MILFLFFLLLMVGGLTINILLPELADALFIIGLALSVAIFIICLPGIREWKRKQRKQSGNE